MARLAAEKIQPYVAEMDEQSHMRQDVIKCLFENGVIDIVAPDLSTTTKLHNLVVFSLLNNKNQSKL